MNKLTPIESDATRWIVIPRGIDLRRDILAITLQWVPTETYDMLSSEWPSIAHTIDLNIQLRVSNSGTTNTWTYLGQARPRQSPIKQDLWNSVFTPKGAHGQGNRPASAGQRLSSVPQPTMAWETAKLSTYLSSIVAAMKEGHTSHLRSRTTQRGPSPAPLSAMMPSISSRALMRSREHARKSHNVRSTSNYDRLYNAFGTVLDLYMPSPPSAVDIARYLDESTVSTESNGEETSIFDQIRSAYGYASAGRTHTTDKDGQPQTWQGKLAQKGSGGLRYDKLSAMAFDVWRRLNHDSKSARSADEDLVIFFETLTGLLPWTRKVARFQEDDNPHPLAGVGQSFTLQTQLGMICDLDLDLTKWQAGGSEMLLSGRLLDICAAPSSLTSPDGHKPRAWTRMNAKGFPLDATPPGHAAQPGLFPLDGTHLTTLEPRQSMQRFILAAQKSRGKLDFESQSPQDPDNDTPFTPGFKSGPLQLMRKGAAQKVVSMRHQPRSHKMDVQQEFVFTLSELTIGIRPDFQIAYPGPRNKSPWRPMLGRHLSYKFNETTLEATNGDLETGRMEGYIPITRMSSSLSDALTVDDELFAWHGWNPALPVLGGLSTPASSGPLLPVATPVPGSNPMFRYGSQIWVRARPVLRDGSSLHAPANDVPIWPNCIVPSDISNGFLIIRYEPLKAPALLLAEPLDASEWLPTESLNHVILGTCRRNASLSRARSARFWLPGDMRDISEVERHGAFDSGLTPRATAFPYHARDGEDFETVAPPPNLYPEAAQAAIPGSSATPASVPTPASTPQATSNTTQQPPKLPIFRIALPPYHIQRPYHPDPLVRGFVLSLARQSKSGQWLPVLQGDSSLCFVHPLYTPERTWPDAAALRIEVSGEASGGQAALRYTPLSFTRNEARLDVHVPPGEQVSLVAWPYGDPDDLQSAHAFGELAKHWKVFVDAESRPGIPLDFPAQGVSGLISETATLLIDHFVDIPDAPSLKPEPDGTTARRPPLSVQQPFSLSAGAAPGSTGGLDVIARWSDPSDDPGVDKPTYPVPADLLDQDAPGLRQAPVCVMTSVLNVAVDLALSDPRVNKVLRPPIAVPGNGTQDGTYALPDTRHRYVRYVPIAHSRVPKPGGGPLQDDALRTREGPGVTVNVLASARPLVPVVRDVLPSFAFERSQYSNSAQSRRLAGVTLTIERGWWSSGPDELLAVSVSSPGSTLLSSGDPQQAVSGWGADPALSLNGKINRPLTATDFRQTEHSVTLGEAPTNVVLYRPEFDAREKCWRVDLLLNVPVGAAQPFLQLALMRYQPHAISGMDLSETVLADFIQLQDNRYASIVPNPQDPTKFRVAVRGPVVDGHVEQSCVNKNQCAAKEGSSRQSATNPGRCCLTRRRSIDAWLEVAPRRPGHEPIWKQHGVSVNLDAKMDAESFTWSGELAVQPRLELPTQRMRLCVMERGLFPREPVKDDPRDLHHGTLYYLDQLEFSVTDYNGDDHP